MGFPSVSKFLVDQPNTKQVLFFGSVVLYPILFYGLHSKIGNAVIFLSAFPVFIAAYAYGIKYGLIASLSALPINYLFVLMSGVDGLEELKMTRFIGLHVLILVGSLMLGYSSLMQRRLKKEVKRRKEVEKRLKHLAHYDQLTEVANRHYGDELMQQMLQKAKLENTRFIIIFIDLNDFKKLNDQYGHHIGDLALQFLANKLKVCVGDEGVVVRNGGDEFLMLLDSVPEDWSGDLFVEKIDSKMSEPMTADNQTLTVSLSCGFASYPEDAKDLQTLLKIADARMYAINRKA